MKVENIAAGLVALLAAAGPTFAAGTTSSKTQPAIARHSVPATRTADVLLEPAAGPILGTGAGAAHHTFPDVPADHWAAQAVQLMADMGIMIGYPNGTFNGGEAQ